MKYLRQDHYDRPVFEVSAEAAAERHRNWREIRGWATGDAIVSHPDWLAVLDYVRRGKPLYHVANGHGWEVIAYTPDGQLAFGGAIEYCDGKTRLTN